MLDTRPKRLSISTGPPCPAGLLRCPVSGQELIWLGDIGLRALQAEVRAGRVRHHDGTRVEGPIDGAYATPDRSWAYLVREEILFLMPHLALVGQEREPGAPLRPEKRRVQRYYDETGWKLDTRGVFADSRRFEDSRSVASEYMLQGHLRIRDQLAGGGHYLLDVGSGPIPHPEYYTHGNPFTRRICVDLSLTALRAARRNLGHRGIYILGDAARLPLRDDSVDAVVCLNTLGLLPLDEQADSYRELARVLLPGGVALVVDAWKSPLAELRDLPRQLLELSRKLFQIPAGRIPESEDRAAESPAARSSRSQDQPHAPPPFQYPTRRWFYEQDWPFRYELACWRSLPIGLIRRCVHRAFGGRNVLRLLDRCERACPRAMYRVAAQTLMVIRKVGLN